jgi:hypothetical protein
MLHSLIREILFAHLEQLSGIASLYRENALTWMPQAERWLEEAETHMARFRFPEVGLIAAARGGLSKASDTFQSGERHSRRQEEKARNAAAWTAVQEASGLLTTRTRQAEDKLQVFDDKLCEGLTAYFLHHPAEEGGVRPNPAGLWRGLKEFEATRALALYVEASLAAQDREYLLERIVSRQPEQCNTE